jgi:hypothetical protein
LSVCGIFDQLLGVSLVLIWGLLPCSCRLSAFDAFNV